MTTSAPTTAVHLIKNLPAGLRDELGIAAADDDLGDNLVLEHDVAVRLVVGGYAAFGSTAKAPSTTVGQRPVRAKTVTLDFPSVPAGGVQALPVAVPGAKVGELVGVAGPAGLNAALVVGAAVTAANTVTVKVANPTGAAVDPASGTWTVGVVNKGRTSA